VVECVFHCLEIVVVDESSHADANFIETIGREVGGAVAVLVLQVKVRAAVEAPGSVGSGAALAHAIGSRVVTVRVEGS
jgi:ribosomal protein S16